MSTLRLCGFFMRGRLTAKSLMMSPAALRRAAARGRESAALPGARGRIPARAVVGRFARVYVYTGSGFLP